MSIHRRVLAGLIGISAVFALAGCGAGSEVPNLPSPSDAGPNLSNEDQVLDAAEEVLSGYVAAVNEIGHDGGAGVERLLPYVHADWYDAGVQSLGELYVDGVRQVGDLRAGDPSSVSVEIDDERVDVIVEQCLDYTARSYIDGNGDRVPAANVVDRQLVRVTLWSEPDVYDGALKIESIDGEVGAEC